MSAPQASKMSGGAELWVPAPQADSITGGAKKKLTAQQKRKRKSQAAKRLRSATKGMNMQTRAKFMNARKVSRKARSGRLAVVFRALGRLQGAALRVNMWIKRGE